MINVIKYDDGLPISVIVPHDKKRKKFFDDFVFPLLEANMPAEIIINEDEGTAPVKRNAGFLKSTQPYVFFCDNDILLPSSHLEKLYNAIKDNNIAFAYSGYKAIVLHPHNHPIGKNFEIKTIDYDPKRLRQGNFISTMSLIKRDKFPMFDESLKRLMDWDVYLTMLKNGDQGVAVYNNEFFAYYLDEGITSNTNNENEALMKIIEKHKIGM